jgi:hypothetical protein
VLSYDPPDSAAVPIKVRERRFDALNLHDRQLIEAPLICREAIGRTESHAEVTMKYEAE